MTKYSLEDIECLYDAYLATPEGQGQAEINMAIDKACCVWMGPAEILALKKKILVQSVDFWTRGIMSEIEETSMPYSPRG